MGRSLTELWGKTEGFQVLGLIGREDHPSGLERTPPPLYPESAEPASTIVKEDLQPLSSLSRKEE